MTLRPLCICGRTWSWHATGRAAQVGNIAASDHATRTVTICLAYRPVPDVDRPADAISGSPW